MNNLIRPNRVTIQLRLSQRVSLPGAGSSAIGAVAQFSTGKLPPRSRAFRILPIRSFQISEELGMIARVGQISRQIGFQTADLTALSHGDLQQVGHLRQADRGCFTQNPNEFIS